ncbi:MAG: hypothetical protein IPI97_14855 [Nitrosomonas sp.]|nr:hypothetical protein [Nitrosomonas sp.]
MASREQRDMKRREARLRNKMKHADDGALLEDDTPEIELKEADEPTPEIEKKEGGEIMAMGPTSWEELDQAKMVSEKAEIVREVTYSVQDLVWNILYSDKKPDQKAKAIAEVGKGFEQRVKQLEKEEKMEKAVDLELLELKALQAKDSRHISVGDRVSLWLTKSNDSFPLENKSLVRAAITRAISLIEKGGGDADMARENIPAIKKAAKEFGIGAAENTVVIEKDSTGRWRAVMWPSNNFLDLDKDIISEKAHLEYVDWVNENMDLAPVFMSCHKYQTIRKNRVDFAGYESGFLMMSSPLEENEVVGLLKAQTLTDIGMSHGTIVIERDPNDSRVITKYRMVEVSDLPLSRAANPFTDFDTLILKEAVMSKVDLDIKSYLATILGDETKAEEFIGRAGLKQKALQEAGVESKEVSAPEAKAETPAADVNMDAVVAQVMERVSKELDVEGLSEYIAKMQADVQKVPVLEALVKQAMASKEDAVAEMIAAPASRAFAWTKGRASQATDNVLDEKKEDDELLKKAKPELGWLSEATGTVPVQIQ